MSNVTDRSLVTEPVVRSAPGRKILAALRIVVGFNFSWSFLDKLLGLNYTTAPESAWIEGGSPTEGYLRGASDGWLGPVWEAMAGSVVVDIVHARAAGAGCRRADGSRAPDRCGCRHVAVARLLPLPAAARGG